MRQSNVIAAALAIGFIVFITLRGELPDYFRLFIPKNVQAKPAGSDSGGGEGSGGLEVLEPFDKAKGYFDQGKDLISLGSSFLGGSSTSTDALTTLFSVMV
jgi:hypothetical protein